MDHPKFLALTDGAWRLWCEGQAYCQKHLTDGLIPAAALRGFRYFSPARLANLTAENVPGKGPCWKRLADGGIQVHDYLEWNDSRAEVLRARGLARSRRQRYNDKLLLRDDVPDDDAMCHGGTSRDASYDDDETANVSSGVVCTDPVVGTKRGESEREGSAQLARFERFWAVYPRKVGKKAAWVEWQRIRPAPNDEMERAIISAVQEQASSVQWRRDGGQYIPHPRTWLHQGRWDDELRASKSSTREFWGDECKRLHGGTCTKRWDHEMRTKNEGAA